MQKLEPPDHPAVVTFGNARFTCLASGIIRMEYDATGQFEDRPTIAFLHRDRRQTFASIYSNGRELTLTTPRVIIRYIDDGRPFHAENLFAEITTMRERTVWHPGLPADANLRGTFRTLDGISGGTDLELGILSRDGWALIDESNTTTLKPRDGQLWPTARKTKDALDWYLFAYGRDYKAALADFTRVTGRVPIPPRYAFGTWWSRYWAYSDDELRTLVNEFDAHGVPLDVLVIDMDWHLDGWTGYSWNPKYFPEPARFLKEMHDRGLRTTLNLHPADGVGKHETQFTAMCKAMGLDPEKTDRVPFDCTDPRFIEAYFKILHHPLEAIGIDFWWMDWQQGTQTKLENLDPLIWLNHLHWTDMQRRADETDRRPLVFSRWGGLGNHRYQIGFSGDTFCNWPSLAFQPYFTSTAGNVGFGYWSHDIGGHQPGPVDPELYARWIQFGAFSPILRTHTTKNPAAERRIWEFPPDAYAAAKKAFQLRYHLIPYIYSAARQCYDTGLPLCRPLYYEWPNLDEAYEHTESYLFGDALLVVPVTKPSDPLSGCTPVEVWLPPGRWRNGFTGQVYQGPMTARLLVPLDEIPIFVREGEAIVAQGPTLRAGTGTADPLVVHVFHQKSTGRAADPRRDEITNIFDATPEGVSSAILYEDDGLSDAYRNDAFSTQTIATRGDDDDLEIRITGAVGDYANMPTTRRYEIRVEDSWPPEEVELYGEPLAFEMDASKPGWSYAADALTVVIRTPALPIRKNVDIDLDFTDDAKDRSALDDGLRGRVRILRVVRNLLGDAAPDDLKRLDGLLSDVSKNPMTASRVLRTIANGWPAYIRLISTCGADDALKRAAIVRMLGLSSSIDASPLLGNRPCIKATVLVVPTVPASGFEGIWSHVQLRTELPWEVEVGHELRLSRNVTSDSPAGEPALLWINDPEFAKNEVPQTAQLTATVTIGLEDATSGEAPRFEQLERHSPLSFDITKTICPSINAWWIVGPFDGGPQSKSLSKVFPPEEQPIDLDAKYTGEDGKEIRWRKSVREIRTGDDLTPEFFTDFDEFFGSRVRNAVAYAVTWIEAPEETDAVLALGSDDGVVAWLNGDEVHRNDIGRPYTSKQDRVKISLKKGINELRLKINQGGGDWAFAAHIETPDGKPVPGLHIRLSPN